MSNSIFSEINPEITRERALDMILASMAVQELALSHLMNTEGEKLQYLLDTLETTGDKDFDMGEILSANQSILRLLETISQNISHLKSRMDNMIHMLSDSDSGIAESAGIRDLAGSFLQPQVCNAMFKCANLFEIWSSGCALSWDAGNIQGESVSRDSTLGSKIQICAGKQYLVSFAVNVRSKTSWQCNLAISLQECTEEQCNDLFVYQNRISCADTAFTASMSGLMVDTTPNSSETFLRLKLISPDRLTVEDALLNIVEI